MSLRISLGWGGTLDALKRRMIANELRFQKARRSRMREAANLLRSETVKNIRSSILNQVDVVRKYETTPAGTMIRSIRANVYKDRDEPTSFIAFIGATPRGKAFYWKFHELGVQPGPTRGGRKHPRLSVLQPTPTALPALERNVDRVRSILGRSFEPLEGVV